MAFILDTVIRCGRISEGFYLKLEIWTDYNSYRAQSSEDNAILPLAVTVLFGSIAR
jgi:hypothetical protein